MADPEPDIPPAERIHDIPRILRALRKAVQQALWEHKIAGNPVEVWRDGRVQWIQPEDIPVEPRERRREPPD